MTDATRTGNSLMRRLHHSLALLLVIGLFEASSSLADERPPVEEAPVVLRVSADVIEELLDDEIEADVPFQQTAMGGEFSGTTRGRGRLDIELIPDGDEARFVVHVVGTAAGAFRGHRRNLVIDGSLHVDFTATKTIRFDGHKFHGEPTGVSPCVRIDLHRITTCRNGPFGKLAGKMIMPLAQSMRPRMEQQANRTVQTRLARFADVEADELIRELNETTPFEEAIHFLYPETKDWIYRLSANDEYLQATYGPRGAAAPRLPPLPKRPPEAHTEFWVKVDPDTARFASALANWNEAQDQLDEYFEESRADVSEVLDRAAVVVVDDWVVIIIGQPSTAAGGAAAPSLQRTP